MRIHELIPHPDQGDLVIHCEEGNQTMVLTPQGAVYNNENTDDLRNMSIAFGRLFVSDQWRAATQEEIEEKRKHPDTYLMALEWTIPAPKPRPKLSIVRPDPIQ